jgi:ubiquinone/menaquinone biosynthesis C-methylase UbiE
MSAEKLKFEDSIFDRVLTSCLLPHLDNPERALKEFRRVTKKNGFLTFYISPEPSLFLRIFRKFTTARKAKRLGFQGYNLFIARNHKNSFQNLITLINHIYRNDEIKLIFRPFPIRSWYINGICIIHIQKKST